MSDETVITSGSDSVTWAPERGSLVVRGPGGRGNPISTTVTIPLDEEGRHRLAAALMGPQDKAGVLLTVEHWKGGNPPGWVRRGYFGQYTEAEGGGNIFGRRSYFEDEMGGQWVALFLKDRLLVTSADMSNLVGDDWGVYEVVGLAGVTRALADLKKSDGLSVGKVARGSKNGFLKAVRPGARPKERPFYLGGDGASAWFELMLREARDRWRALAKAEKGRF